MYILPQILGLCSKNLIVDTIIYNFKEKLHIILDNLINNYSKLSYADIFLDLQDAMNKLCIDFLIQYFETLDNEFKCSSKRKEEYYINKSNVERTLVTIFGTITFKRTLYQNKFSNEYYFYLDDLLGLEAYKNYDPLIRGILIENSVYSNPNHTSYNSSLNVLALKDRLINKLSIPKSTIYKFKKEVKIREIKYDFIPNIKKLYVMVDEKWIHEQDKNNPKKKKWIMSKCFVTFTNIERKGKRSRLVNKHIFITSSDTPWKEFMNHIYKIYDFETITTINLLSDAGSWILSGAHELKLYSNNKIIINACEFHVKQKINRSTTDKDLRVLIANIIYEKEDKEAFIKEMDKLIDSKTKEARKQKITEYKNYILKHWKGIVNMKNSICKSSMEAHIEHCIASSFSSVPKAYSKNNIEIYLKLQEMKLNGIDILKYYLESYNSNDGDIYNKEKEVNYQLFEQSTSNIPLLHSSYNFSNYLYSIAHR